MSRAPVGPVELEYETFGEPSDPAVLLVMGLGAQLTAWDEGLCRLLADVGRFVIRFDNRDCGLSTHLDGVAVDLLAAMTSILDRRARRPAAPYTLSDLAADAVGLLDHLGIERAHVVGASMGGMIAQTMAIEQPKRVRTLTSIMSNTGEREYGQPTGEALQFLVTRPPGDREGYVEYYLKAARVFSPHRYFDDQDVRDRAEAAFDRCYYPEGVGRQLAAIMTSGDRADGLAGLQVPTLVVHGRVDTLVHRSGGERTAELVPGADLVVFGEMGHDLPRPLWPRLVDLLAGHTA
jgi:pimeloyl-ACP methyl ester carboxylesterase